MVGLLLFYLNQLFLLFFHRLLFLFIHRIITCLPIVHIKLFYFVVWLNIVIIILLIISSNLIVLHIVVNYWKCSMSADLYLFHILAFFIQWISWIELLIFCFLKNHIFGHLVNFCFLLGFIWIFFILLSHIRMFLNTLREYWSNSIYSWVVL